jgi:hypothetical protein
VIGFVRLNMPNEPFSLQPSGPGEFRQAAFSLIQSKFAPARYTTTDLVRYTTA